MQEILIGSTDVQIMHLSCIVNLLLNRKKVYHSSPLLVRYVVLELLALPTLLMYPVCFMLFKTRPRVAGRLFTCLNLPDVHYTTIAERRQVVRMSESDDTAGGGGVFDLLSIGGAAANAPSGQPTVSTRHAIFPRL